MTVIRFGTIALMLTGLSHSLARFQARSAFFQVGFTTAEAESVVNHPVRREIILIMILAGNAGFVTVVSTVILSFTNAPEEGVWSNPWFRVGALLVGIAAGVADLLLEVGRATDEHAWSAGRCGASPRLEATGLHGVAAPQRTTTASSSSRSTTASWLDAAQADGAAAGRRGRSWCWAIERVGRRPIFGAPRGSMLNCSPVTALVAYGKESALRGAGAPARPARRAIGPTRRPGKRRPTLRGIGLECRAMGRHAPGDPRHRRRPGGDGHRALQRARLDPQPVRRSLVERRYRAEAALRPDPEPGEHRQGLRLARKASCSRRSPTCARRPAATTARRSPRPPTRACSRPPSAS